MISTFISSRGTLTSEVVLKLYKVRK